MAFKPSSISISILRALLFTGLASATQAAIQTRDGDAITIDQAGAWSGLPGTNDIARWNNTSSLVNDLATSRTWLGIELLNTTGTVVISGVGTLTLGGVNQGSASGGYPNNDSTIDLSSADLTSLTIQTNLALLANSGQIWNINTGRTFTHNSGTFTRNAGATLNIRGAGSVIAPNIAVDASGIIGPWATFGTAASTSYATRNLTTNQIEAYTYTTANSALDTLTSSTTNYQTGASGAFGAATTFNTLRYTGAAATISGDYTANGILNGGTGILTLSGNATIGSTNELILSAPDSTRSIVISGSISDNGVNPSKVIKAGDGTVTLSNANSYTGETVISRGFLNVTHSEALGSTGVGAGTTVYTAGGGFLTLGNNVTIAENFTFVGGDPTNLYARMLSTSSGNNNTITGTITLQGQLRLGTGGSGQVLNINGGVTGNGNQIVFNLNSGTVNFNTTPINLGGGSFYSDQGGTINVNVAGNIWNGTTLGSGSRLVLGVDNALPVTSLQMGVNYGTAASTLDLNGFNQSVTQVNQASINPGIITSTVERAGGGPATLTINQTSTTLFNGTFAGSLAVTKSNTGRLRLGGASTHTGDTNLTGGVVEILQAAGATLNAVTLSNSTNTINLTGFDVSGLSVGQSIAGTGLDGNTFITAINYGTKVITLSRNTQGTAAAELRNLTFGSLTGSVASSTVNLATPGGIEFGHATTSTSFGGLKGNQNLSLNNLATNAVALTLGANNQNTVYTGALSGSGSITKEGTGISEFGGNSTHTGNTTINAGTFLATNTAGSATGAGSVFVNNTATLGGTGSITGGNAQSISLGSTSQLMIGRSHNLLSDGAQTLTLGNSTAVNNVGITVSGDILFDLYGTDSDQLDLFTTGTTDLTSATILLAGFDSASWVEGQTWKLIDWSGTAEANRATAGIALGTTGLNGFNFTQDIRADGYYITASAIPEPSRALLLLVGSLLLAYRRKR
ncbi:beta strand repeat-containing protein [Phragmitibacter flavus]|nr:autotransporter-associated beta strand repeat-containing protein [Phragmitibacter flavus]